ncbi:MAG: DUF2177 family protein [Gemmatimonadaceae bacterium]
MNIAPILKAFVVTGATMFALDMVWLGVVAKALYERQMATLLRPDVKWVPALIFYVLYVAAVVVFVVMPAAERKSLSRALGFGAFFGLTAYATYDLTSFALIRDFPLLIVIVDLAWGMALTTVVSGAGYWAATR